jgi:AraC-like DNA-binding protein
MEQIETIFIKGMVCNRCIIALQQALKRKSIPVKSIELGKISVFKTADFSHTLLFTVISSLGFEVLVAKQLKLVESIKESAARYISAYENKLKLSELLSMELNMNYDQLSSIFSNQVGMTLERYILHQKIEKVKFLLTDTKASVTDISYRTNYSSVHHLSRQFKEITGHTPSQYREMNREKKI